MGTFEIRPATNGLHAYELGRQVSAAVRGLLLLFRQLLRTLLNFVNVVLGQPMPPAAITLQRHDAKEFQRHQAGMRTRVESEELELNRMHLIY